MIGIDMKLNKIMMVSHNQAFSFDGRFAPTNEMQR